MTITPANRMAEPATRKPGRPKKSEQTLETRPVTPNAEAFQIMAQSYPPCCGRGQTSAPTDPKWRTVGSGVRVANVKCPMCGARYDYVPAQSRRLG